MNAQSSKGQRFTGLSVDQQDLSVQDHTVTSRECLRDVVLKVGYLKHHIQDLKRESQQTKLVKSVHICITFSPHKNLAFI